MRNMYLEGPRDPERGASLLETMVAAVLGMVIIGAGLEAFTRHHGHFVYQRTVSELQQDIRGGVNLLGAELRLASPLTKVGSEEIDFRANINDVQGTLVIGIVRGQNTAQATPNHGWVKGKTVRLCSQAACEEQSLARDGTSGHMTFGRSLTHDFPAGSRIEVINDVRYYLSRAAGGSAKLMREVDRGANPLIERLERLSFTYLQENGRPAIKLQDIRLIRLELQTNGIDGRGGRIARRHVQELGMRSL